MTAGILSRLSDRLPVVLQSDECFECLRFLPVSNGRLENSLLSYFRSNKIWRNHLIEIGDFESLAETVSLKSFYKTISGHKQTFACASTGIMR